jgi:hypothetical protein
MDRNLNSSRNGRLAKFLLLTVFITAFCTSFNANAQYRRQTGNLTYGGGSNGGGGDGDGWGIIVTAGYDKPTGDFGTTFSGAPAFSLGVVHNLGDFTFNANIGYVSYKPKQDTIFVDPTDPSLGYFQYGHFTSIEIYAGVAYNVSLDPAKLYFGIDVGSYYNSFSYSTSDASIGGSSSGQQEGYIAPKVGFKFPVSDNISIGLEGKYNIMLSSSSGTGDSYDYGYATTVRKTISANFLLIFNF